MSSEKIRNLFLDFFKKRNHTIVPSSSLVPDDPSVLITTAGMQQFKPYFTGQADPMKDFNSLNTTSIQKSFRTSDIDEVGDESHLTFFEMLGNFSFGDYFKEKAIEYSYDFIVNEMKLDIDYVSVFKGDHEVPADMESERIWRSFGVERIEKFNREDNFWGPTGIEGPCGPTTEIYVKNSQGQSIEIWNIVFNEYYCHSDKRLEKLETPGVDTGMGFERLVMVVQKVPTIFDTDLFLKPSSLFAELVRGTDQEKGRIIADHLRASIFLLADGIRPSNKEAGYILRRLIRRLLVHAQKLSIHKEVIEKAIPDIINFYGDFYPELKKEKKNILKEFNLEAEKFHLALEKGLKEFDKRYPNRQGQKLKSKKVGKDAFNLYQSYGFPVEVLKELLEERLYKFDQEEFDKALQAKFKEHQEISRAGLEKKFGGHGLILNTGELKAGNKEELNKVLRLHTVTHLLQQALRDILGDEVEQRGSDVTSERTRFDFSFSRKMTSEEIQKVEDLVNQKIKENLKVSFEEMPKEEAEKTDALHFFKAKYPDRVKVYFIAPVGKGIVDAYSKEFCGGPHVENTAVIGRFKILKEKSVAAGVRRIRGVLK